MNNENYRGLCECSRLCAQSVDVFVHSKFDVDIVHIEPSDLVLVASTDVRYSIDVITVSQHARQLDKFDMLSSPQLLVYRGLRDLGNLNVKVLEFVTLRGQTVVLPDIEKFQDTQKYTVRTAEHGGHGISMYELTIISNEGEMKS